MKPKHLPADSYDVSVSHSGFTAVIEGNVTFTNVTERLGFFYDWHLDNGECVNPIARLLNPEHGGIRLCPHDDVWILLFYKSYRVSIIKCHNSITGPHAARLYYKSTQLPYLYWLATLQIADVMFYDEQRMLEAFQQAVVNRQFYIAPNSRKDLVAK